MHFSSAQAVHPEHLNTPRQVYDDQQQLRWKWDQAEPFGVSTPNENPSSLGAFEMPLRFPGQYADKENGLHYNARRDYDPAIGRYVQSDPIALQGGLNTYLFVSGSPLGEADPSGLQPPVRMLGQPGPLQILPPGPLGVMPGQAGYVFPLTPPPLTAHQKCMLGCDLAIGSPCKWVALQTPGMPYGPLTVYLVCNYGAHEVCSNMCDTSAKSCKFNDPSYGGFPSIPPLVNDPDRRRTSPYL